MVLLGSLNAVTQSEKVEVMCAARSQKRLLERVADVPWLCDLPASGDIYRIRGSGVTGDPEDAANTRRIVEQLEGSGIKVERRSSGSPGNADAYILRAAFLDGGLWGMTGNYWMAPRGVWIVGAKAADFVLRGLDRS